jgi:hypothetical protein
MQLATLRLQVQVEAEAEAVVAPVLAVPAVLVVVLAETPAALA